jgi:hypothetical protein
MEMYVKDQLFLMKPGFKNAGLGPFYCGEAPVEGLLSFFPDLRDKVDVTYIEFPRPRKAIVDLVGENHQSIPVIVLADDADVPDDIEIRSASGRRFIDDQKLIRQYLSMRHDLPTAG